MTNDRFENELCRDLAAAADEAEGRLSLFPRVDAAIRRRRRMRAGAGALALAASLLLCLWGARTFMHKPEKAQRPSTAAPVASAAPDSPQAGPARRFVRTDVDLAEELGRSILILDGNFPVERVHRIRMRQEKWRDPESDISVDAMRPYVEVKYVPAEPY